MHSTRTRVHARISNGHPREEKRACRTKVRGLCCGLCRRAEQAARAAAGRLPREDPRAEVGEEVCVGVDVGVRVVPVEFKLNTIDERVLLIIFIHHENSRKQQNYLARSAKLPNGLYILLALILF